MMKFHLALILFLMIWFQHIHAAEFILEYYPKKVVMNAPSPKKKDKTDTVIIENKLMSTLIIQIIDRENIISNKSIRANQTGSIIFNRHPGRKYFVRTIQPASELIELSHLGRKVEIP